MIVGTCVHLFEPPLNGREWCGADAEVCIHCLMPYCADHQQSDHTRKLCREYQDDNFACASFDEWRTVLAEAIRDIGRQIDAILGPPPKADRGLFFLVVEMPDGGWSLTARAVECGERADG